MADEKISVLTDAGTLDDDELIPLVDDPAGTPVTKRTTVQKIIDRVVAAKATAGQILAGTTDKLIDAAGLKTAITPVALTDAASIAWDMGAALNAKVTLGGNRTLANPSNAVAGQGGVLEIIQDGTGSRTLGWGANYKFAAGTAPTLSTAAGATDTLAWYARSSTEILISEIGTFS